MSEETEEVQSKHVAGRRSVRYESMVDFLTDAERLAASETRTLGNWSKSQIYEHLARSLDVSIDGAPLLPAPVRFILRLLFKKQFTQRALPAGFNAPTELVPDDSPVTAALGMLRKAVARQSETEERAFHPGFGKITLEEWNQFNLRHAEMHMSFIVESPSNQ
jgi:hypothetical protein